MDFAKEVGEVPSNRLQFSPSRDCKQWLFRVGRRTVRLGVGDGGGGGRGGDKNWILRSHML